MTGFEWNPSPAARVAMDGIMRSGVLGVQAWLDAEIRHREAVEDVRAIVATIDDPRLVP